MTSKSVGTLLVLVLIGAVLWFVIGSGCDGGESGLRFTCSTPSVPGDDEPPIFRPRPLMHVVP